MSLYWNVLLCNSTLVSWPTLGICEGIILCSYYYYHHWFRCVIMTMIKFNMEAAVVLQIILGELLILCESRLHDCVPSTNMVYVYICTIAFNMVACMAWKYKISYWHVHACIYIHIILLHKKGSILDSICTIQLLIYKEQ